MRYTHIIYIAILAVIFALPTRMSGQTDAQMTQYFALPTYYNPAAVGDTDYLRIRAGARLQWVGIDNAPTTFLATGDMPFKFLNKKFGVGLLMQQESLGLYKNLTVGAQLGYKINLFKGVLTAGVQVGFINETFKGSEVFIPDDDDYHQGTDEAIPMNDVAGNALDLGIGAYYTHRYFWAGLSMTHANSPTVTFTAEGSAGGSTGAEGESAKNYEFQAPRTLYFMGGSNIAVKNTLFEVIPSFLVKSDFTFTGFDVTCRVRYNKFLTAGIGYRYNDAVSAMLSAEIKGFFIGYSYDYPTTEIAKASSGSHEIVAGYRLKLDFSEKNRNKHKSIRIM